MKKLYPLLSVLFLIYWGCNPSYISDSSKNEILSKLEKSKYDGKEIVFVDVPNSDEKGFTFLSHLNGKRINDYHSIKNKRGKVIGVHSDKYSSFLVIQLDDGQYVKSMYQKLDYTYFPEHLDSVKNEMIGKEIWLNEKVQNTLKFSGGYSFKKFDKVKIVDIEPMYTFIFIEPYMLKVQSSDGQTGYVYKFMKSGGPLPRIQYFTFDPLYSQWESDILNSIKFGKVRIGMTREQVMVSMGQNPSDVSTNESKLGIVEWWSFKNPSKTIMFMNGKVDVIQNN
jgi:hypothetical protein